MRSTTAAKSPDDRTTRARIRDAAIRRFADDGIAGASVRAIAAEAGVSAALVIHHFGSKDELRAACDEFVATTIREQKSAAMAAGPGLDPMAALRDAYGGAPLLRYLAQALVDGSPRVNQLVDEMAADATEYTEQGVETGVLRPTDRPADRAALLTIWSLGALVLHEHVERLLGARLHGSAEELAATAGRYFGAALEMFSDGLLTETAAEQFRAALRPDAAAPHEKEEDRD